MSFDYDLRKPLSPYAKRKIKIYSDTITTLTARPNQIYRSKDPQKLRLVQSAAQHDTTLSQLRVAFIPASVPTRVRVTKEGTVIMSTAHVTTRIVPISVAAIANGDKNHVKRQIASHAPDASRFTVQAGRYEIPVSLAHERINAYLTNLVNQYNVDNGHHARDWLFGVNAHEYTNQADYTAFARAKQTAKGRLRKVRKSSRNKQLRDARREKLAAEKSAFEKAEKAREERAEEALRRRGRVERAKRRGQ